MSKDNFMTGSKKHQEARKLFSYGIPYKQIGQIIANMENRKKPYHKVTVETWLKHGSWSEYAQSIRDAAKRFKVKRDYEAVERDKEWNTAVTMPNVDPKVVAKAKREAKKPEDRVAEYITKALLMYDNVYKELNLEPNTTHLMIMDIAQMIQAEELK